MSPYNLVISKIKCPIINVELCSQCRKFLTCLSIIWHTKLAYGTGYPLCPYNIGIDFVVSTNGWKSKISRAWVKQIYINCNPHNVLKDILCGLWNGTFHSKVSTSQEYNSLIIVISRNMTNLRTKLLRQSLSIKIRHQYHE